MRLGNWLVVSGVLLGGCFDEGGDESQRAAAVAVADGLIAFADIKNNIPDNGGAAGEALLKFIQTPVAAENLISPPDEQTDLGAVARFAVAPDALPGCLTTMGSQGCDSFDTNTGVTCEAGPFTFTGHASRTCAVCTDLTGSCTYDWRGVATTPKMHIGYVVPGLDLQIDTSGTITTTLNSISFRTTFDYRYNAGTLRTGSALIESCGPAMLGGGVPQKLVNSKFAVKSAAIPTRCAVVSFDASGTISASNPTVGRCSATPTGCP